MGCMLGRKLKGTMSDSYCKPDCMLSQLRNSSSLKM